MKRLTALIAAALLAAPAIASASMANAMYQNTDDGTQNIAVAPASQVAIAYIVADTAPPPIPDPGNAIIANDVFEKVLAVNHPADEARIIASPQPAISGGDTVNNGAVIDNYGANLATNPDVGKVAFTGNIGTYGFDGIYGVSHYALGGGAPNIAVVITVSVTA